jgi:oxygen-independent coproporphyrinogen-3 oxidase
MEGYFERVVETLTGSGYRWYETANFCVRPELAAGRDLRARHNLGYWLGHDYLGLGIGAVSTVGGRRWRNRPKLGAYLSAAAARRKPPRELESLDEDVRRRERLLLGLRLDEPVPLAGVEAALDPAALARLTRLGLAEQVGPGVTLTERGRFLGGAVTVELLAG